MVHKCIRPNFTGSPGTPTKSICGRYPCVYPPLRPADRVPVAPMRDKNSSDLLVTRIAKLFSEQLAQENDYLRQENRTPKKLGRPRKGNLIPMPFAYPGEPARTAEVRRESELGGLLNHHHVEKAA